VKGVVFFMDRERTGGLYNQNEPDTAVEHNITPEEVRESSKLRLLIFGIVCLVLLFIFGWITITSTYFVDASPISVTNSYNLFTIVTDPAYNVSVLMEHAGSIDPNLLSAAQRFNNFRPVFTVLMIFAIIGFSVLVVSLVGYILNHKKAANIVVDHRKTAAYAGFFILGAVSAAFLLVAGTMPDGYVREVNTSLFPMFAFSISFILPAVFYFKDNNHKFEKHWNLKYWFIFAGAIGLAAFLLMDWVDLRASNLFMSGTVRYSLNPVIITSRLGSVSHLFDGHTMARILMIAVLAIYVAAMALLVVSLVKVKSQKNERLALFGVGLAVFAALIFLLNTISLNLSANGYEFSEKFAAMLASNDLVDSLFIVTLIAAAAALLVLPVKLLLTPKLKKGNKEKALGFVNKTLFAFTAIAALGFLFILYTLNSVITDESNPNFGAVEVDLSMLPVAVITLMTFLVASLHLVKKSLNFRKYWQLYIMLVVPLAYFLLFRYGPMFGAVLAFRWYRPGSPLGVEWRGFEYFEIFMRDPQYWRAFINSLTLSLLGLVINFPGPIIFAILLNEIRKKKFKKLVQTISYMPRFMSTVVVVSFLSTLLMPITGIVNKMMGTQIHFMEQPEYFRWLYVFSDSWQFTGFTAIIYLAAISGINPDLYEAAQIDGANRWKQIWNVTIPGILPTVMVMLILNVGRLLSLGFEKILLMQRPRNMVASDILDTYVFRMAFGDGTGNYSLATAAGLFGAVISLILVLSSNYLSKKATGESIY